MKKLFAAAFLSMMLLPLNSGKASAWNWPWKCCCGHCYDFSICCKQYNAFSPVCFGKIFCDGCCPTPYLNGLAHGTAQGNGMPIVGSSGAVFDSQFLGQLPAPDTVAPPTFNAPMPSPADSSKPAPGASLQMPAGTPTIQSTGYQTVYPTVYAVPAYYPTMNVPGYWYNNRN